MKMLLTLDNLMYNEKISKTLLSHTLLRKKTSCKEKKSKNEGLFDYYCIIFKDKKK